MICYRLQEWNDDHWHHIHVCYDIGALFEGYPWVAIAFRYGYNVSQVEWVEEKTGIRRKIDKIYR